MIGRTSNTDGLTDKRTKPNVRWTEGYPTDIKV